MGSQRLQIYQNIKLTKYYTVSDQNNVSFLNALVKTRLSAPGQSGQILTTIFQ